MHDSIAFPGNTGFKCRKKAFLKYGPQIIEEIGQIICLCVRLIREAFENSLWEKWGIRETKEFFYANLGVPN